MTKALPGRYFIGDPCYVINHLNLAQDSTWDRFCAFIFDSNDEPTGYGEVYVDEETNITLIGCSTMYGDGSYAGKLGTYGVDAGLLGVGSINHCTDEEIAELIPLGTIHEFVNEPRVDEESGTIFIYDGDILVEQIETADDDSYEDISEEDYEDNGED